MGADARMKNYKKKQDRIRKKIGWILLMVLLATTGCASGNKEKDDGLTEVEFSAMDSQERSEEESGQTSESEDPDGNKTLEDSTGGNGTGSQKEHQSEIQVYICGQVRTPGVYTLEEGSRICDVVQKAGGLKEEAADTYLNQAQRLEDGQKIYVPSKEEAEELGDPVSDLSGTVAGTSGTNSESGATQGKVSINRADKAELMTLSGIGETKAEAILSYREANQGFKSLEELKQVEGIKDGTFQKIKDRICL